MFLRLISMVWGIAWVIELELVATSTNITKTIIPIPPFFKSTFRLPPIVIANIISSIINFAVGCECGQIGGGCVVVEVVEVVAEFGYRFRRLRSCDRRQLPPMQKARHQTHPITLAHKPS
jgi:hypothetical protein